MRPLVMLIALLALIATPVLAQQRSAEPADEFQSFNVDDAVTLDAPTLLPAETTDEVAEADAGSEEEASESSERPADAPFQERTTRQWIYLVGAIVAAGIILAVLL